MFSTTSIHQQTSPYQEVFLIYENHLKDLYTTELREFAAFLP